MDDKYALVIIDMQPFFVERTGNHKKSKNKEKVEALIENQIKLIEMAKNAKMPIIFIEYETHGDTNSKLKKAAGEYRDIRYFTKTTDGMFEADNKNSEKLSQYLGEHEVGSLIVAGANGGACVEESIEGALAKKYSVIAYTQGIADFNYESFLYPYSNKYTYFKMCETCKFKEINDYGTLALKMAVAPIERDHARINDSSRSLIKIQVLPKNIEDPGQVKTQAH